ncbi:MAG: PAS domain S-box protein [Nitrospira sp.]|nr:PAS domain S-box protein [Nitrospira sp.]
MASLLIRFGHGSLWRFVLVAVVLSCLFSLLISRLIHGHITWDYPFTAGLISLMVAPAVLSLAKRMRALEREIADTARDRAQDLAARTQAEEALRQSEERFREFMDHSPAIAWMKDAAGRHVYVNQVFARRFQLTQEQWLGRTAGEMFPREIAQRLQKHDQAVLADGLPKEFVEAAPDPDGTLRDWWSFKFPFQDRAGKHYVGGVAIDVTDRKRAEAALQVSEERLRLALKAAQLGIWDWDIRSNAVQWSDNVSAIFGFSRGSFAGTYEAYLNLVHPQDRDRLLLAIAQSMETNAEYRIEHRIVWLDGTVHWVACRGDVLHGADGMPSRMLGTVMDITARKEMELKLAGSEAQLRAILDHSPALIFLKDPEGRYLDINRQFEHTFHLTREQTIGRTDAELFPAAQAATFRANDRLVFETKHALQFEEVALHDDGPHTSIVFKFPLMNLDGVPYGIGGVATDITERKQAEVALAQARDQAMEAARLKSEFLATMSHEIRTPMNGVIGMNGLLLETVLTAEQREYAETVRNCGDHLLMIINDILNFSKIEAGRLILERVDFDLRNLIEDTLDLLAEQAQRKGLDLVGLVDAAVPSAVCGDPGRLRQVFTNLLGNAVKFTDSGEVVLRLTVVQETGNEVLLRGEVTDTGIGISPEGRTRLFQTFSQVDGSNARKYGGTGLGLAICKRLTELMGGEIGVESTRGKGSRFWFTVRLTKAAATGEREAALLPALDGRRVCLVGKPGASQTLLLRSIADRGMQGTMVKDGAEAVVLMRNAVLEERPFDLAILEEQQSGVDGTAFAQAMKADPVLRNIPVIVVTAFGQRGDAKAAQDAGVSAYLTRPIHQSALWRCLATLLKVGPARPDGQEGATRPLITRHSLQEQTDHDRPRLLVVDDQELNQVIAVSLLERLGCLVDVVGSGQAAIAAAQTTAYDLIFMDCQMPDLGGYQAAAMIRRSQGQRPRVPIIALTGLAQPSDREKWMAAGMDDCLIKPLQFNLLEAILRRWLRKGLYSSR